MTEAYLPVQLDEARAEIARLEQASIVIDRPGRPVAAPCAIDGCQFDRAEAAEARLRAVVEALTQAAIPLEALAATECDESGLALSAAVKSGVLTAVQKVRAVLAEGSAKEEPR